MEFNNLINTINEICLEKNLSKEKVLEAIEQALAVAYRKDFGRKDQNIRVKLDLKTGKIEVFDVKTVIEDLPRKEEIKKLKSETEKGVKKTKKEKRTATTETQKISEFQKDSEIQSLQGERKFNPRKEIFLSEAKKIKKEIKVGDEILNSLEVPSGFGRVATQAAKQVIIQRLREAEREVLYKEFKEKEGKILPGIVQRKQRGNVLVDLGKITALLPFHEQIEGEKYLPGQKIKVYILEVREVPKGPEIIVSHAHPEILREFFKTEIPEVANGLVEIKGIAREAGLRSKVAVATKEKGIDPVGTCIGSRGSRIQTIISELGGEKIDIIEYSEDPIKFIINAFSPAKITSLKIIDEEKKIAQAKVKPEQLSLAIGREGQNVRLVTKLTGWKIEIERETENKEENKKEV